MPNLFDYLEWRGDLTLAESPLNEVDNLIFSLLSYVDLEGIIPNHRSGGITVREAAAEYFFTHPEYASRPLGLIIPADILTLFRRAAHTRRFRDLVLLDYVNEISEERETQFSGITVRLPEEGIFVAFRGTDDTIVGWKEDFKLSILEEVPAQTMAADYLNRLDLTPDTKLYIGGHSKGGNLAVWGAVHAEEQIRERIQTVWSNDGPGFSEGTVTSEAYKSLATRIRILIPEDSLVGLLLEHDENFTVIQSNRKGLFQHDALSWEVLGGAFLRAETLSPKGIHNDTVVRERIDSMTHGERREFIRLVFNLLESTGAKTLTELHRGGPKIALSMMKTYRELSKEDQETVTYLWEKLTRHRPTESKTPPLPLQSTKKKRNRAPIRVILLPLLRP
ncbi:MAG: DUF2974 domain-containing protein [Clostridia bacterium]|nr:DUF2974 domain-containing protein [Clostridia bacterium]